VTDPSQQSWDGLLSQLQALGSGAGAQAVSPTGPSAASALGGNFLTGGKGPVVYWGPQASVVHQNTSGRDSSSQEEGDARLGIKNRPQDSTKDLQGAVNDWYTWSDAERSAFGQRLYKLGLVNNPNDYGQLFSAWQGAVQEASNFYMAAGRKVTPWQAIDLMANTAGGGLKPTTQTSTSVKVPTVEDAHAATKQIFQALMGRGPNQEELDRYASMMTGYAQKHPSVTKTTTDAHGNQTSTTSGGTSDAAMGDMLSTQAKADPEYGAYQAATTYWNALVGALGGNGNG
jgi:hypothetical protein